MLTLGGLFLRKAGPGGNALGVSSQGGQLLETHRASFTPGQAPTLQRVLFRDRLGSHPAFRHRRPDSESPTLIVREPDKWSSTLHLACVAAIPLLSRACC